MESVTAFPYEGDKPYIFVSYSHQDMERVLPILQRLNAEGFRIWYDEGIDPGTEWPESIAHHLSGCTVCVAFISKNSINSRNCRREINYALGKNLGFLWVMIEPCELSPGMEMQLSSYLALMSYKYTSMEHFFSRLTRIDILQPCRCTQPGNDVKSAQPLELFESSDNREGRLARSQGPSSERRAASSGKRDDKKKKSAILFGAVGALALLIIVGILAMKLLGRKTELTSGSIPAGVSEDASVQNESVRNESMTGELNGFEWTLENGVLTLRGKGRMQDFGLFGEYVPWNNQRESITAVVVEGGVTQIGNNAFQDCTSLRSISLPNGLLEIGNDSFSGCLELNKVTFPDTLERIGTCAFASCGLQTVSIPQQVNHIDHGAFAFNHSLTEIHVHESNQWYCSLDGVLFNKDLSEIICCPCANGISDFTIPEGVERIANDCFGGCGALSYVAMPDSLISIGDGAFQLTGLNTVSLPKRLQTIGQAAFYATPLVSITIPASVQTISDRALTCASQLESIIVESGNLFFSSENGVLFDAQKTVLISYPCGKKDGEYTVPNSVNRVLSGAFSGASISKVVMPESVRHIGEYAFSDCYNLREVIIYGAVDVIEDSVFLNCTNLISVTIPASVQRIGRDAFLECVHLATVRFGGSKEQWADILIESGNDPLGNAEVLF